MTRRTAVTSAVVLLGLWPAVAGAGTVTRRGPGGMDTTYLVNETYFNFGALLGLMRRDGHTAGAAGAELSVHHFTDAVWGAGGFAQWQWMGDGGSSRFCLGVQGTAPTYQTLGVELGAAYETPSPTHASTVSVHAAPFASIGALTLSLRLGLPVYTFPSALPGRRFEGGLNLAIKIPSKL